MNILYIDDDAEDREIFRDAVNSIDPTFIFNTAEDGRQGFDTLEELIVLPDYIFLDVNMPVMNGKEFLKRLKATIRLKTIPVIMYSTSSQPEEIREYLKLGACDFIVKPSNFDRVCEVLISVINRKNENVRIDQP